MDLTNYTTLDVTPSNNLGYCFYISNNLVYAVYSIYGISNLVYDPNSRAGLKLPVPLKDNSPRYSCSIPGYYNVFHKPWDDSDARNIITGYTSKLDEHSVVYFSTNFGGNAAQFETWRDDVGGYLWVSVLYECQ